MSQEILLSSPAKWPRMMTSIRDTNKGPEAKFKLWEDGHKLIIIPRRKVMENAVGWHESQSWEF